ncbi:MAG: hypothetical protein F6J97_08490 [Leptolyngbya sp. SIO4C1]|nr:hypothetical protein [Leptolyngbya sp. SIO4C1]
MPADRIVATKDIEAIVAVAAKAAVERFYRVAYASKRNAYLVKLYKQGCYSALNFGLNKIQQFGHKFCNKIIFEDLILS